MSFSFFSWFYFELVWKYNKKKKRLAHSPNFLKKNLTKKKTVLKTKNLKKKVYLIPFLKK
jgi:hypothetical protein